MAYGGSKLLLYNRRFTQRGASNGRSESRCRPEGSLPLTVILMVTLFHAFGFCKDSRAAGFHLIARLVRTVNGGSPSARVLFIVVACRHFRSGYGRRTARACLSCAFKVRVALRFFHATVPVSVDKSKRNFGRGGANGYVKVQLCVSCTICSLIQPEDMISVATILGNDAQLCGLCRYKGRRNPMWYNPTAVFCVPGDGLLIVRAAR